jgi:hypothetical protein
MGLSPGTVAYVIGLAVLGAVIVGVVPGLKATGRRVQSRLGQPGGAAMRMGRTWTALIVGQVAVAVAILPLTDGQGAVWVMYLLAYHSDPGDVSFGSFSHKGDSEFILLRIVNSTLSGSHWYADRAILSAHWGTDADDSYSGDAGAMEYTDDVFRGRPLVHVAKDKHANYRSRSECNWGGGLWTDTCDGIQVHIHVPVLLARNIGNYTSAGGTKKLDCVPSEQIAEAAFGRQECFFTGTFFGGWLNSATYETSAGAYAASLRAYGFKPQTFTVIDNECREYARYC